MSVLSGKKILLGITAGIAAYKTASLVRLFIKSGAEVQVIMTPASKDFITPLTLSTLSKNPVHSTFYSKEEENELWNNHVELGLWADLMLIAPVTANTLSKMSSGTCDNLLIATYLSAKCPVYFAPAMDLDMYAHPSTITSLDKLQSFGNKMIPATSGELASGLVGEGRMAEPQDIISFIENDILSTLPLKGKKVLVTAGPTYEAIDPVRFIGNHSSGKMGFEIAKAAANLGAEVFLITGPSEEKVNNTLIQRINVVTAEEMYKACHHYFSKVTIAVLSAAVADYKPKKVATEKIKKKDTTLEIELAPTKDILASLGAIKQQQYLVGFALETNNEIVNALSKLESKNLDAIIANDVSREDIGFNSDDNEALWVEQESTHHFSKCNKAQLARDLVALLATKLEL